MHYSFSEQLHSDQGRNFESQVIKELCRLGGVRKTRTTPYHPRGDPSAKRGHRSLLKMLGTLSEEKKSSWKDYVHSVSGEGAQFQKEQCHGVFPTLFDVCVASRLSVEAFLGISDEFSAATHRSYAAKLQESLSYAYKAADEAAKKRADQSKAKYDAILSETKNSSGGGRYSSPVFVMPMCRASKSWLRKGTVHCDRQFTRRPACLQDSTREPERSCPYGPQELSVAFLSHPLSRSGSNFCFLTSQT